MRGPAPRLAGARRHPAARPRRAPQLPWRLAVVKAERIHQRRTALSRSSLSRSRCSGQTQCRLCPLSSTASSVQQRGGTGASSSSAGESASRWRASGETGWPTALCMATAGTGAPAAHPPACGRARRLCTSSERTHAAPRRAQREQTPFGCCSTSQRVFDLRQPSHDLRAGGIEVTPGGQDGCHRFEVCAGGGQAGCRVRSYVVVIRTWRLCSPSRPYGGRRRLGSKI